MEGSFEGRQNRPRGIGVVVLLVVMIAVALASAVLVPLAQGQSVSWSNLVNSYEWLIATIIIILVIVLVLYGAHQSLGYPEGRRERRHRRHVMGTSAESTSGPDAAVNIARERYARGEISADQMEKILRDLEQGSGESPHP